MDFGFGNFLDKFEDRFGKRLTTLLLALVAIGVMSVVANLVSTNIIIPLYEIISDYISPSGNVKVKNVIDAVWNIAVLLWAMYYFVTMLQRRREMRDVENYKDSYRRFSKEYEQYTKAVGEFYEIVDESISVIDEKFYLFEGRLTKMKKDEIFDALYGIKTMLRDLRGSAATKVREINELLAPGRE